MNAVVAALMALLASAADDFDLYTRSVLNKLPAEGAAEIPQITLSEISKAPSVLGRSAGCFLVVKTDDGNWAKLVVRQAIRKQGESEVPIVVIERYQTLRPDSNSGRLAAGTNTYLFDGFAFNLDIGQVVPAGSGGDIVFRRDGSAGHLATASSAKLFLVTKPLVERATDAAGPSRGPVVANDFAGAFQLNASGKWSGKLSLRVTDAGLVSGSYISDQTGGEYPVKGSITQPAHRIRFSVDLPAARQEFDGHLWTEGKHVIAGTMTLGGNAFGFIAVREGSELTRAEEE